MTQHPSKFVPKAYPGATAKNFIREFRDVAYKGNAAEIWHLLAAKPTATKSEAAFETSLRRYRKLEPLRPLPRFDTLLSRASPDTLSSYSSKVGSVRRVRLSAVPAAD